VRVLVFNAGSSSLKCELIDVAAGTQRRLAAGSFAATDASGLFRWGGAAAGSGSPPAVRTLAEAAEYLLGWIADRSIHGTDLAAGLGATAHRIVHGGALFRDTTLLGEAELAALAGLNALAPLHNPPALAVIEAVRRRLGAALPLVGVFDTAYYANLPAAAHRYAIPADWVERLGVRRYGFHGTAHRYLCQQARLRHGGPADRLRIISLQLGRGCSVTATRGAQPVATSMGFTPLEGLVMGTRCGDLDPGALLHVMERDGLSAAAMRRVLNEESGLLALSGRTADMRELLALERAGDSAAALAVEIFCRRARHYVGAYLAELGGADVIAFGGGIGENCPDIRRRIIGGLEWAGIDSADPGTAEAAGPPDRTQVLVVAVDEAAIIAAEARALLERGVGP
jgi:acetate kinase